MLYKTNNIWEWIKELFYMIFGYPKGIIEVIYSSSSGLYLEEINERDFTLIPEFKKALDISKWWYWEKKKILERLNRKENEFQIKRFSLLDAVVNMDIHGNF